MAKVSLMKLVITNTSFNIDVKEENDLNLEVKNELTLKLPEDMETNSFLLVFDLSICEPKNKRINISVKANAFFKCDDKLDSYDEVITNECFPLVFELLSKKIDSILEVLDYPKLNISLNNQS